ncbi:hypothetical protein BLSTO_03064 [Blastocystis sp. subtype 1]
MKTGTTIVGLVYKNGVIIAADQRATTESLVVDKETMKVHYIAPNIYCCGAGTAADADQITELVSNQLALMRLQTGKQSRLVAAMTLLSERLFQYGGNIQAALILGGCDLEGPHLYGIWPEGSVDSLPYDTLGSGSYAAMSVLEHRYKPDMEEAEAIELAADAINAGIFNDLGSGGCPNVRIIRTDGTTDFLYEYRKQNKVEEFRKQYPRPHTLDLPKGTTTVISEIVTPIEH